MKIRTYGLEPIAMAIISHALVTGDGVEVEVTTWTTGKTQDECYARWAERHPHVVPTKYIQHVVPRD